MLLLTPFVYKTVRRGIKCEGRWVEMSWPHDNSLISRHCVTPLQSVSMAGSSEHHATWTQTPAPAFRRLYDQVRECN